MKKTIILTLAAGIVMAASAEKYKVIAPMSADSEGAIARLVNYDTGATLDSLLVDDEVVTFEGTIDESVLARVVVDGARMPVFILEPGTISFGQKDGAFGTMLNDQLRDATRQIGALQQAFQAEPTDAGRDAIYGRYEALCDSIVRANEDNALGYYFFLDNDLSQMPVSEITEVLAKYPAFAGKTRVQKMLASAQKREATQPGGKFIDFEVTQPDGTVKRLSDYVGRGKYTLVDFWASWCGPCIRQTAVLKDIYNKYKDDDRLQVLGVAVWDRVEDTERAIKDHELPWESIVDAQTIPTDLYGIAGIPCIILFGPDGTILSRDKQDDALRADVDAALAR